MSDIIKENNPINDNNIETKNNKSKRKRVFIGLLFISIISIFALLKLLPFGSSNSLVLETFELKENPIEHKISSSGFVQSIDSAEISSNLNFEFIKINVKEGDKVEKGDILGVLNNSDLQSDYNISSKELEIAQVQLREQQKNTQLSIVERQLEYDEAKKNYESSKILFEEGEISNDELNQSKILMQKSYNALEGTRNSLSQLSSGGSSALAVEIKKDILNAKKDNLNKANITSPISGTVTRVNAKLGRIPTAQEYSRAMFIVENLDDLIINVKISEFDIQDIKLGQKVIISSDILKSEKAEGIVSRISPTGERVETSTSREMRIPVEITITKKSNLIPGVSATAEIISESKPKAKIVPIESIIEEDGKKYILLGNDGIIKKIEVKTGIESISNAEIISDDVKVGDIIITKPAPDYKDGDSYKAME